ncbi:MAG: hypothetical protein IT258_06565 [Saprospiraceae bacterium]|nr:hypothetical protein [Saprospiraceae bacterium]
MKKITLLAAIVLALLGCKKEEYEGSIPTCIAEKLSTFKKNDMAIAAKTMIHDGERVFWLQYDMTNVGCGGQIYTNEDCEVVCKHGFRALAIELNCPSEDSPDWEVIWEK